MASVTADKYREQLDHLIHELDLVKSIASEVIRSNPSVMGAVCLSIQEQIDAYEIIREACKDESNDDLQLHIITTYLATASRGVKLYQRIQTHWLNEQTKLVVDP